MFLWSETNKILYGVPLCLVSVCFASPGFVSAGLVVSIFFGVVAAGFDTGLRLLFFWGIATRRLQTGRSRKRAVDSSL